MVFSIGLQSATERMRQIQSKLETIDTKSQAMSSGRIDPESYSFDFILDESVQQQSLKQQAVQEAKAAPLPANAPPKSSIENMIEAHAEKIGINPSLVKAVARAESGFNPKAVSPAGAKGLMQLMPSTARELGVRSIMDPSENVRGGAEYLKKLLNKYHSIPHALAAYNAGPGAVDRFGGVPPYRETRNYVAKVTHYFNQYEQQRAE